MLGGLYSGRGAGGKVGGNAARTLLPAPEFPILRPTLRLKALKAPGAGGSPGLRRVAGALRTARPAG